MSKEKTDYTSQELLLLTTFETLCDIGTICCVDCPCKDYCELINSVWSNMLENNLVGGKRNATCGETLRNYLNALGLNETQQTVFLIKYLNKWYCD